GTDDPNGSTTTTVGTDDPNGSTTTTVGTDDPNGSTTTTVGTDDPIGSTTTSVAEESVVNITVQTVNGFYLTIDEEFNKAQVKSIVYSVDTKYTTYGEDGEVISEETVTGEFSDDITDKFVFNDTPASVFEPGESKFKYDVVIYASEDIVAENGVVVSTAGEAFTDADGNEVTVPVYVGVKGDADLDGRATSTDASVILKWYGKMSIGGDADAMTFSNSPLVVDKATGEVIDARLDQFAAFLADVDSENEPDNWTMTKSQRTINSSDASFVLKAYGASSTGKEPTREVWNEILGKFAKQ
ncbi:MAG: hypothetical protein NC340_01965, partial [Ruminococcus flavefaciens]|nr:hypothetical protein [Ruminococcus flavefaciens]MCM1228912.1 hypothetical protein [Ruminococcus flavefaciens]